MKIAYLSTFYPLRGGIAQFNAALYRELEKEHEIKAFTFSRQYPDLLFPGDTQYVSKDDNADKIPSEELLDTINPFSYISTASKIKKYSPDIIITKFWMPFFAPSLGWVLRSNKSKSKNICVLDNVIPHERRPGDIALTKFFLNQNHEFIAMSDTVENDLISLKPDAKFQRMPHPLYDHFKTHEGDAKKELNLDPSKKYLLFFGFIRDYKGLDLLLESLSKLDDSYHLIIAGEVYGSFDKYDKMISDLNLSERIVKHVKYISDDEVPIYFSAADLCVLPYKSATQSGIVGISYNFDLPILATDVGSLAEMIEPYDTGIIVKNANSNEIAEGIKQYFSRDKSVFVDNISRYKEVAS